MKTYTLSQLKGIARDQGYKLAALETPDGNRIASFNQLKVKVDKHLDTLFNRLKADVNPDGVYNILLAHSISKTKTPDRYAITKGKVNQDTLSEAERRMPLTPVIIEKQPNVLSWDKALEMQQTIANQQSEIAQLKMTVQMLETQLQEEELEEGEAQGQMQQNDLFSFLKEAVPSVIAAADRYFDLEEKKLGIAEQRKLNGKTNGTRKQFTQIEAGTQPQLDLIDSLYKNNQDAQMNRELDRLEEVNPELYKQVIARLGLDES